MNYQLVGTLSADPGLTNQRWMRVAPNSPLSMAMALRRAFEFTDWGLAAQEGDTYPSNQIVAELEVARPLSVVR